MPRSLLFVHPHPDDEAIACGGTIARHAAAGHRVVVVTCTGGEEGENQSGIDLGGRAMGQVRREEMADALAALGVADHVWLGYRDSGMVDTPSNEHPDSFHQAPLDAAARRLAAVIRDRRPVVVVSDDANGTYGHPDHVKANRVTRRAVELAGDPTADVAGRPWVVEKRYVHAIPRSGVLELHQRLLAAGMASPFGEEPIDDPDALPFGVADEVVTTRIDVADQQPAKRAAMAAHRSQIGEDSFFLNIPPEIGDAMFASEHYVLEDGTPVPGPDGVEDDLLAGVDHSRDGDALAGEATDEAHFRAVMGRFATGVTVMTACADGVPHGMTANAVASLSLDPLLVLVCVEREALMATHVQEAGAFALSILAEEQRHLSDHFADPARPLGAAGFAPVRTHHARTGSPVLEGAVGWLDCRVHEVLEGGDHLVVLGEVVALDHRPDPDLRPLVWFASDYTTIER